jgi:Tol biopolymer transport system component
MRIFARFLPACFIVCLLLLLLMRGLGQSASEQGIIAYTQVDESQDPRVLLMDVPTGNSIEVTSDVGEGEILGRQPYWSPDGSRLAFWTYHNRRNSYAFEMSFPDYNLQNLTEFWHYFSLPLYGANGERAFANNPMFGNSPLYLVEDGASEATILLENIVAPQFSPDGKYLAYLAFYNPETQNTLSEEEVAEGGFETDLYILNRETGEEVNWTVNLNTSGLPFWSADSRYIAFSSRQRNVGRIYLLDLDTETLEAIPIEIRALSPPSWSSDGKYIAFVTGHWENLEIALLDMSDYSVRNISNHEQYDVEPTWSPDSQRLAFISGRDGQAEIYVYELNKDEVQRISYSSENEADPAWRPR